MQKKKETGWYNYSETKPEIDEEVLARSRKWVAPGSNPKGIRIGRRIENMFISSAWDGDYETYGTRIYDPDYMKSSYEEPEEWHKIDY